MALKISLKMPIDEDIDYFQAVVLRSRGPFILALVLNGIVVIGYGMAFSNSPIFMAIITTIFLRLFSQNGFPAVVKGFNVILQTCSIYGLFVLVKSLL